MSGSTDIAVIINGQTFTVSGGTLVPQPRTEFELEILRRLDSLDHDQKALRGGIAAVKEDQKALREEFTEFKGIVLKRLDDVDAQLALSSHAQSMLQTSVYWGFALITFFITAIGVLPSLWRKPEKENHVNQTQTPTVIQIPAYYPDPEIWVRKSDSQHNNA